MINFENYTIRPLEVSDLHPYFELVERNRKRLEDFFTGTVSRTKDVAATEIFLKDLSDKREAKQYFPYVLVDNSTNAFVGFFDLKNIDWAIPKTEIGCYTDEQYAGKGLTILWTIALIISNSKKYFSERITQINQHKQSQKNVDLKKKVLSEWTIKPHQVK